MDGQVSCGFPIQLPAVLTLSFACPVLDCERRSSLCFKLMAAQGHGYSGTGGLLLGLSSINQFGSDLVLLLRRYFNTHYILSPAYPTLLRCVALRCCVARLELSGPAL